MFNPKIDRLQALAERYPERILELECILDKPTNVYIDFANVVHWQEKLGWHISLKRLKQFLDSFDMVKEIKFYNGTLSGDSYSDSIMSEAKRCGYIIITKPVKIMKIPIDVSSVPLSSTKILEQFIRSPLLKKLNVETIEFLNARLKELNKQGVVYLEDLKCNFDVEIGRDMLIDYAKDHVDNFILWSGDSDFADPIQQLLHDGKKVMLFITARKVATELNELRDSGLAIFDIQKIRNFICWNREIQIAK